MLLCTACAEKAKDSGSCRATHEIVTIDQCEECGKVKHCVECRCAYSNIRHEEEVSSIVS